MDVSSYLKLPDVALRLGVSEKTARRYIKSGALPSIFVGNAYRVHPNELATFVERESVGHSAVAATESPKAPAPRPSAKESPEQRRTLYLELLAIYAIQIAGKMMEDIDSGHVTPEWGLALYREMTGMSKLFNEMLKLFPGPVREQELLISESEKQGLDKVSQAIEELDKVAKKLDKVLGETISAREREALKANFSLIQGELRA